MSIRILIVDDHGIVREGLRSLIGQQEGMEIVGEAVTGKEAVELADKLMPDVVLMDVSMPVLNGVEAARQIIKGDSGAKVLALSAYCNKRFVADMLKAGVSGYVLKDCMTEELVRAIGTVMAGERYLSTRVAGIVIDQYVHGKDAKGEGIALDKLTSKEREILQLVAEGHATKEIARMLNLSIKTVDGRRREVMHKLNMSSVAELTKFAIREELTSLDF